MNDILIYQDIVQPGKNNFLVKDLIPNGVRYFFQMDWTSFDINTVVMRSKILNVTTLMSNEVN